MDYVNFNFIVNKLLRTLESLVQHTIVLTYMKKIIEYNDKEHRHTMQYYLVLITCIYNYISLKWNISVRYKKTCFLSKIFYK